jgi:hypothetical protein
VGAAKKSLNEGILATEFARKWVSFCLAAEFFLSFCFLCLHPNMFSPYPMFAIVHLIGCSQWKVLAALTITQHSNIYLSNLQTKTKAYR